MDAEPFDSQSAKALFDVAVGQSNFTKFTEPVIEHVARGAVTFSIPFRPDLTQHHGFLHGALVAYLADTACAWAAATAVGDVLTAQLNLHYLAPGIGERFRAKGRVLKASKRQVVCAADVFAEVAGAEKLIATATGTILRAGSGS